MPQLPVDCLNEIFEYLENDKNILHSCLLVNRLWCEIAVRMLWRDIWSFKYLVNISYREKVLSQILNTLITCLPNKSKDLLYKNGIITTSIWKPSLFNYASFCKVLLIHEIDKMIQHFLEKKQSVTPQSLKYKKYLLSQEILKMFMKEIPSLKSLDYDLGNLKKIQDITFPFLPEAKNCLKDLSELKCSSDLHFEFFYQLSQICHNIQSLTIEFNEITSNGLADLISLQNNLKSVSLKYGGDEIETEVISSLTKFSSTLTKLQIEDSYMPLSFIATFTSLEELTLSFEYENGFDDFGQLQHVAFPKLKVLKFLGECPNVEVLIKFLEINGKNMKELYVGNNDNSLNLAISKFCLNLKSLFATFIFNEIETLKMILNNCQYLESIGVWCGGEYLNDKEILEVLAKYSPKNFYELKLDYWCNESKILPKDLESFIMNWKNQVPLSLTIVKSHGRNIGLEMNNENMKIIERYMKMGLIKYGKEEY